MYSTSRHFTRLHKKWTSRHRTLKEALWRKHKESLQWASSKIPKEKLVAGSLGLLLLAAPSHFSLPTPRLGIPAQSIAQELDTKIRLMLSLKNKVPQDVRPLTDAEEQEVGEVLSREFGFRVITQLKGIRLNRSYGYIGQEQHLARFPGDGIPIHFDSEEQARLYGKYGIAPGLGAWGYFAPSYGVLTQQDKERERYYIAVQTFLAPGYNEHVAEYRDFFKYRKMLVVNPQNGKAIVAAVADAGPAQWTGKHLGGSPEVMGYLERYDGSQKGSVLYFFIDDPQDSIPLGPIEVQ
ncbi:MAG: hypothetical protein A2698_00695 [Candidatus Levybacteria bacterium RIFCSPHIGHO2_01_FULL_42_15]|nr:MAG: hypothetical protein A2698_00695 [Candidatus Levybacteria bacterium RIFCSPHIGHO2_01_FULL_42_15]